MKISNNSNHMLKMALACIIPLLLILLLPLFGFLLGMVGEEFVLFLAILAGNGEMPLISVIIGGILGMLFIGQIYFFIGRSKFISQLDKNGSISKMTHFLPQFIKKFGEKNIILEIFITKFIYGTRAASIILLGTKTPYRKFLISDIIATIGWAVIMIPLSWLSGRGIQIFLKITKGLEKFFFIGLLLIVIYFLSVKLITSRFKKNVVKPVQSG